LVSKGEISHANLFIHWLGRPRRMIRYWLTVGLLIGMTNGLAQSAEVSFAGKRITIIVSDTEGTSSDRYARVIGPALARALPGAPTVVIRNVPGSGSMAGLNQFQQRARPDGLTLATTTTSQYLNFAFGNPGVAFDLKQYVPILINAQGVYVYTTPAAVRGAGTAIQNIRAYQGELRFGATSPTSAELRQLLAFDLLGIRISPVWGLGSAVQRLAFMRGETQINMDSGISYLEVVKPLINEGRAVALFSYGTVINGKLVRDPLAPEVPTIWELYREVRGAEMSGIQRRALDALSNTLLANKGLVLPAGTPPAMVEAYRVAIDRMVGDAEIRAQMERQFGPYPMFVRDEAIKRYRAAVLMDPVALEFLRKFAREKHGARW
jgi:tripartite-type tricarboxylate transporter receptor subunit TctC